MSNVNPLQPEGDRLGARSPALPPLVLVVDDDAEVRSLLADILKGAGFRVHEARNGLLGLELARSIAPSVMVLDGHLPLLDGWEVSRRMKADPSLRSIPIVALTADLAHDHVAAALEAGCKAFLAKPVSAEPLIAAVRKVLHDAYEARKTVSGTFPSET